MSENKEFKPFVPASKTLPEFTSTSIILGIILAVAAIQLYRAAIDAAVLVDPSDCVFHAPLVGLACQGGSAGGILNRANLNGL